VEIAVSDDGRGFDASGAKSTGFGLTGMRERAELAGGELDIESTSEGTTVRAKLAVRRRAADEAVIRS
jgi:signal transduction histidine kinase